MFQNLWTCKNLFGNLLIFLKENNKCSPMENKIKYSTKWKSSSSSFYTYAYICVFLSKIRNFSSISSRPRKKRNFQKLCNRQLVEKVAEARLGRGFLAGAIKKPRRDAPEVPRRWSNSGLLTVLNELQSALLFRDNYIFTPAISFPTLICFTRPTLKRLKKIGLTCFAILETKHFQLFSV